MEGPSTAAELLLPVQPEIEPLRDAASTSFLLCLAELDRILIQALAHATAADPDATQDQWRGLRLESKTIQRIATRGGLLADFAGSPAPLAAAARRCRSFALIADLYDLSDFAVAALALALAPEVDERYARVFAFLQDDITRKAATPSLALDLFCTTTEERIRCRKEFAFGAPLIANHIVELQIGAETSLTERLTVDAQVRQMLLAEPGIDPRLAGFCTLRRPQGEIDALPVDNGLKAALKAAAAGLRRSNAVPLRLALCGAPGAGHERVAEAIAAAADMLLLRVDARFLAHQQGDLRHLFGILRREALLANAVVDVIHGDILAQDQHAFVRDLFCDLLPHIAPAVVVSTKPNSWLAAAAPRNGFVSVLLDLPPAALRRAAWRDHGSRAGISLSADDLDALASGFRLSSGDIEQAVSHAAATLRWRAATAREREGEARQACFAAARAQGGHELARLARRISPRFAWDDIVVPDPVRGQLREICERVSLRDTVLGTWRFADKLSLGRGISALFAGPSGTGKTMAAEVIASALGIDLFKIDLATVVSKYIGETEQNLDRIFRAAENVNGILLFDEADALFGKRSEVRDSRDRYANLEISYLLQKIEEFEGVAILSTNLHNNLDDAFIRRLSFIVYFPFPEAVDRLRIWNAVWPAALPRDCEVDLAAMAKTFKLSGGNIKSAALAAAYYAAAEGKPVALAHIMRAVEREYQKMGRPLRADEIAPILATGVRP